MRLRSLQLVNFRGFERFDHTFHERLSVFVGVNGSGKSSVLEAIRLTLADASKSYFETGHSWGESELRPSDIKEGSSATSLSLSVVFAGEYVPESERDWTYTRSYQRPPAASSNGSFDRRPLLSWEEEQADLLSVSYSVRRALIEGEEEDADGDVLDHWAAFKDAFDPRGSLRSFVTWFRAREDVENEQRLREDPTFRDRQLQAVRDAVTNVMGDYQELFVQRRPRETLVLSKRGGRLGLHQLSDGEKCLLAMVGDLARRMAMVARGDQDPLDVEAIVMIDEIELHLHPRWQREVVPALLRTFPKVQFVLTTHSPQVLGSVAHESIIMLDGFKAYSASSPTRGRDSTSILVDVMGLPEHPKETAEKLHRIAVLLDEEKLDEARGAIEELARALGDADQEVVRLRSLLGFLES